MEDLTNIDLGKQERVDLLIGVKGVYALAGVDIYSTNTSAPQFQICPIQLYISKALNKNYKDIADKTTVALLKAYQKEVKDYNNELRQGEVDSYRNLWSSDFLGSLQQIVCNFVLNKEITEQTQKELDSLLQRYYNGVMDIIQKSKYEITDIELNGEKLYRRIK